MKNLSRRAMAKSCAQVRLAAAFPFTDAAQAVCNDGAGAGNREAVVV
jgi:hypothetical protein